MPVEDSLRRIEERLTRLEAALAQQPAPRRVHGTRWGGRRPGPLAAIGLGLSAPDPEPGG
jgi:hypothetical protein